mmetsp:Transcript_29450/g.75955  ORF Transcript_29450/g.75955 Transcript_29450/m.75955 type:complete len:155 (-) Transcript_29450:961-1425(-)
MSNEAATHSAIMPHPLTRIVITAAFGRCSCRMHATLAARVLASSDGRRSSTPFAPLPTRPAHLNAPSTRCLHMNGAPWSHEGIARTGLSSNGCGQTGAQRRAVGGDARFEDYHADYVVVILLRLEVGHLMRHFFCLRSFHEAARRRAVHICAHA